MLDTCRNGWQFVELIEQLNRIKCKPDWWCWMCDLMSVRHFIWFDSFCACNHIWIDCSWTAHHMCTVSIRRIVCETRSKQFKSRTNQQQLLRSITKAFSEWFNSNTYREITMHTQKYWTSIWVWISNMPACMS